MNNKTGLIIGAILVVMVLASIIAYAIGRAPAQATHFAILKDVSDTNGGDCGAMAGVGEQSFVLSKGKRGSTITAFVTGDKVSANEPRKILEQTVIPSVISIMHGENKTKKEKAELLERLQSRCQEAKATSTSPIFQAVKRGVDYLQGIGKSSDIRYLFVITDGEEIGNVQINQALNQAPGSKMTLPSPISNPNVRIIFCGFAQTVGQTTVADGKSVVPSKQRDAQSADRQEEVWKALFTNPELVEFQPFCPKPTLP